MQSPFVVGLALGVALGGAGTYLALEQPWGGDGQKLASAEPDAGADEASDSTDKRRKRRRRRGRRGRRGQRDGEVALKEIDERIKLTAADRKLVWRGPKIVLPKKNMDFAGGGGGRSLNQGEISDGVSGKQKRIVSCIAEARGQAELAANITLKFLVSDKGGATKVRVRAPSYLLKQGLYECTSAAVRGMRFPSTGGHTVVTVPFDLSF